MTTIYRSQTFASEDGLCIEASDMALRPGYFPETIGVITNGVRIDFRKGAYRSEDGDLLFVVYLSSDEKLTVYND